MSNRTFFFFVALCIGLGVVAGYELSTLPKLEPNKVLNLAGQSYTFLAVLVLSELITSSQNWRKVCVDFVAPFVMWFSSLIPLGAILGGFVGQLLKVSSGKAVSAFAFSFWLYSLIPVSILNETVTFPVIPALKALDSRWRWFGLYLLANGVGFQLAVAMRELIA